ncbi:MAG: DUF2723 domain-containing protein [Anaerolineae bacterium]
MTFLPRKSPQADGRAVLIVQFKIWCRLTDHNFTLLSWISTMLVYRNMMRATLESWWYAVFMTSRQTSLKLLGLLAALAILLLAYLPTIQTIPNGSENYYMIDVGETQIVLNRWGTLHATGYPLYVMSGSALVSLLCAFGISSATAPAVVSLLWGVLTLVLIYALALR